MQTVELNISSMTAVKTLVGIVEKYPFDMDMRSGRYVVDAKSMLGLFSLDLSRPVQLDIYSDDTAELMSQLEPYLVKEDGGKD